MFNATLKASCGYHSSMIRQQHAVIEKSTFLMLAIDRMHIAAAILTLLLLLAYSNVLRDADQPGWPKAGRVQISTTASSRWMCTSLPQQSRTLCQTTWWTLPTSRHRWVLECWLSNSFSHLQVVFIHIQACCPRWCLLVRLSASFSDM